MTVSTLLVLQNTTADNTVGALFLGVVAAMFMLTLMMINVFGINTLQMYWYYHLYPKDSLLHKFSVAILWVLDALHLALTLHAVYSYIVTGFGNVLGLQHIIWSIKLQVSVNVVIILMVHSLYALRVWILGEYHRGVVGYLVAFVLAGGFVIGIVLAYQIYAVHSYFELERISWIINSSLATATGIDFLITAAMCYYLWRSQAPASRLNSRISTIIQYTLSTGLLTSACSLSSLFSFVLLPNTFIFLGLQFILTKLYVASFLTMLNARKRTVTTNTPSTNGLITENNTSTPVTDLVPRRYQLFARKFHTFPDGQSRSQSRTHRLRLRSATSSFWSPGPPPTLPDYEHGYQDYLPSNLDLEDGRGTVEGQNERSLSDESETIRGTVRGATSPTSPLSPASVDPLVQPPLQRPPSVYGGPQINPPAVDMRPLSSSWPWHAR